MPGQEGTRREGEKLKPSLPFHSPVGVTINNSDFISLIKKFFELTWWNRELFIF